MTGQLLPIGAGRPAMGWAELQGSLRHPSETDDPVLRVLVERTAAGSRPGERRDPHLVCLAVEGGGMRGSVSAGMCVALEAAGLVPAFDRIYGCSAGALNGAFTATGQALLGATTYEDSASRRFIDARRLVRGRPMVDLELVFDELLARKRPLCRAGLDNGPDFRALAVSPRTGELRVLSDLRDPDEILGAVRASCSVPLLNGAAQPFRGEWLVDGGFLESVPYRSALREGATHVLALRSRDAGYRLPPYQRLTELAMRLASPTLATLVRARPARYNREAEELEQMASHPPGRPPVTQVTVPRERRLVEHLGTDVPQIRACMRLGATAMAALLLGTAAEQCEAAA
jgi:predicted patatin/cPLA2 family phospholipase